MFRRFLSYYKPYRKIFVIDMLCASAIALFGVAFPIVVRFFTQEILQRQNPADLIRGTLYISCGLLLMYLLEAMAQYYVTSMGHIMGAYIEYDMRRELFAHLEKLSFSFYDQTSSGHMVSRILSDLFDITELAHHGPENIILSLVKLVGAFIFLFTIDIQVTLVLLGMSIFMLVFSLKMNQALRRTSMNNRKRIADINAVAQDSLSGIRTVASFNNEKVEQEKFEHDNRRFLESKIENYRVLGKFFTVNGLLQGLMYIGVILSGGMAVARGRMEAPDIFIYILYINMFLDPIRTLINFTEQFQKGMTGFSRVCEILDIEPEIQDSPDAVDAGFLKGDIEFQDVSFCYEADQPVLEKIELQIPAGKTLAIVGPSGAGKTTFCSLIPRFYEVDAGSIQIDGHDIRSYTLASLRRNIGLVQQDVYIFNTSIRDNIAYGKTDATEQEIIEAAKRAHIHDFIISLPEGYETRCGEHGMRLSGGQKQRLSIARVFLKNPPILILDEATSALDNQSEVLIQEALEDLSRDRTTIVIAHRLSTIRHADEIIVLTEEGIEEQGSHADLMEKNGLYHELYALQFRDASETVIQ